MIQSEIVSYNNFENKTIIGFYDYIDRDTKNSLIIIPPAFGETKRDSLKISYFLVKNGFNVLRYDTTCHAGESEGEIIDATFGRMKNDLISTLDFVEKKFNVDNIGVVSTSLAVRIAVKACSEDKRIKFLLGLVGIIDIRSTLKSIYYQDIIGEILEGNYQGEIIDDIMGFEVSIDFAISAISEKYHDLESTKADMKKINIPITFIVAENDPWVNINDTKNALDCCLNNNTEFIIIPNAMHQINENPDAANLALRKIVINCRKNLNVDNMGLEDVIEPTQEELTYQWKIEEERLKNLLKKSLETEKEFWGKYLSKFVLINKSKDYRSFLKQIIDLLDIRQGENILDAGCGNGHFGAWLLESFIEKIYKEKIEFEKFSSINYFGIDFVEKSIKEGILKHFNMLRRIYKELYIREKYKIISYKYILVDLDYQLPLIDNCFDKICCNLVISYVKDAQFTVSELFRTLKPGGKILFSSLKPFVDLSQIYRNFVVQTENDEELEEARKLLSAAGKAKQKESAGFYNFFSEKELEEFLRITGAKNIRSLRTFSNQANITIGEK